MTTKRIKRTAIALLGLIYLVVTPFILFPYVLDGGPLLAKLIVPALLTIYIVFMTILTIYIVILKGTKEP